MTKKNASPHSSEELAATAERMVESAIKEIGRAYGRSLKDAKSGQAILAADKVFQAQIVREAVSRSVIQNTKIISYRSSVPEEKIHIYTHEPEWQEICVSWLGVE